MLPSPEHIDVKQAGGADSACSAPKLVDADGEQQRQQVSRNGASDFSSAWTVGTTNGSMACMAANGHQNGEGGATNGHAEVADNKKRPLHMTKSESYIPALSSVPNVELDGRQHFQETPMMGKSLFQERLFNQPSTAVEAVLAAACEAMGFDIAEVWLRTGPKTHQLINSHLRPAALEDSVRNELVDVYYGERSSERTHRLSPALCKRAKEAMDVVWVTAHTDPGADALRCAISDVRTAVAVPVCHETSNTNITFIYFSIKRAMMRPPAVEFLVHMSLAAAVAAVNFLSQDVYMTNSDFRRLSLTNSYSGCMPRNERNGLSSKDEFERDRTKVSVTGAQLDLKWSSLRNVEYLTDGGNSWIHTAVLNGKSVVVKTLKPECQDLAVAINEIEGELEIHAKLNHPNIVTLYGAGSTSKGVRFVVLERLDGGTLSQVLGYDTRIRDRRRRFWQRKHLTLIEVLSHARSLADALAYCHGRAIPGCVCLHRDLKPDNIGFTLDGTIKIMDFGLARILENASQNSDDVYQMSGETGSLRYMAPEVAEARPYNHKADVYSFGIILWELLTYKKPYEGLTRDSFYERVVYGGERPPISKKWPKELSNLLVNCWSVDMNKRPSFKEIVEKLDVLIRVTKGGVKIKPKGLSSLIDRHSTWF